MQGNKKIEKMRNKIIKTNKSTKLQLKINITQSRRIV